MKHRPILDEWFKYLIDDWLDKEGKPQHHPSVEPLIVNLRKCVSDANQKDKAWHCIEQIEKLYDHMHRENYKMSARMFLECGVAAYQMGNAHEAISFLTRSTSSYTDDHNKGVSCWLLGCVHWYVDNSVSALASWENAYRHFREQKNKSGRGSESERWYSDKIQEMEDAIKRGADTEKPPFPRRRTRRKLVGQHTLQSLPVIGQIRAGTPLDVLPPATDNMDIHRVHIDEKEYFIVSLIAGQKTVHLPQNGEYYFILRVIGNSMNQSSPETIEDGDYVILREQHTADHRDIVAAVITNDQGEHEQLATLKRYLLQNGKVVLQPESDDPHFQEPVYISREFDMRAEEFQIRGIAIAVLKPV